MAHIQRLRCRTPPMSPSVLQDWIAAPVNSYILVWTRPAVPDHIPHLPRGDSPAPATRARTARSAQTRPGLPLPRGFAERIRVSEPTRPCIEQPIPTSHLPDLSAHPPPA
jgi:hypothetical protein